MENRRWVRPRRPRRRRRTSGARSSAAAAVVAVAAAAALAACSRPATTKPTTAKTLSIVAGENFWGSVVSQLAGQAAHVTSIVTDPNADPHSYSSSTDDARGFATADYVVLNGAGYDSWADKLLSGNPNPKRKVFTVADLLGKKVGANPHFWYQPDYVTKVTDQIEADLKSLAPAQTAYFDAQRGAFNAAMAPVNSRLADIASRFSGTPVASTESIFVYLAQYLGLNLISPPEFMQAVAEGNDPPSPSVAAFQNQITGKLVKVLVFNSQTSTVITTNIKNLAAQTHIPAVGITETIQPPNARFQTWFGAELISLQNALQASGAATRSSTRP